MRYIRMYKGSEDGSPGVTLYEVDRDGWVHRQLQVHTRGLRFSPEDILLRRPVSVGYMAKHPDAEEISVEEFEAQWGEVDHKRGFRDRLPNPWKAWRGRMHGANAVRELAWVPSGAQPGPEWLRVPGFVRLFVLSADPSDSDGPRDQSVAWATQRELFLEPTLEWNGWTYDCPVQDGAAPIQRYIDAPGLTGLWDLDAGDSSTEMARA